MNFFSLTSGLWSLIPSFSVLATEMLRRAKAEGIPHNVLWDAKKLANVKSRKDRTTGRSYWEIPDLMENAMGLGDGGWWEFEARLNRGRMKDEGGGVRS